MQSAGDLLLAGASRRSITPDLPFGLAGYGPAKQLTADDPPDHRWYVGRDSLATSVHDESFARAVTLAKGGTTVTLVSLDKCLVHAELVAEVRRGVADLGEFELLVGATHSHSSPGHGTPDEHALLVSAITEAVVESHQAMRPARLGWARGRLEEPAVNRRDSARFRDPDVSVLRVETSEGEPIAAVVNYTCHPNVLGSANVAATADFPGYASRLVEHGFGGGTCLFFNGAAGDINPSVHPFSRDRNIDDLERAARRAGEDPTFRTSHREARRLGNLVGAEALRVSEGIVLDECPVLRVVKRMVSVPTKTGADLEHFMDHLAMSESARAKYQGRSELDVELHALRIGDGLVTAIAGEPFADIGRRVKESFPGQLTTVFGYVNDWPGYIPYAPYFHENRYESVATPFDEDGCRLIEHEAIRITSALLSS